MGHSESTAAPLKISVNGNDYVLSPLTVRDFGELEQWARQKMVNLAVVAADRTTNEKTKELLINRALVTASKLSLSLSDSDKDRELLEATNRLMSSPDALIAMLNLSLRHKHKGMTEEKASDIAELCPDIRVVVDQLVSLSQKGTSPKVAHSTEDNP